MEQQQRGHPTPPQFGIVSLLAKEAVQVKNDQIIVDPSKMVQGLGYHVNFKGRLWWVENVDGDTIRYYRGPKV